MNRTGEFELIASLFAPLSRGAPGALDLKDDAAILEIGSDAELVVTADAVISGVHFRATDAPGLVAQKALRVNLSDLAAKGAQPLGFLQTLLLNETTDGDYLDAYARGLALDVAAWAIPLMGGDTTAGPGPFSVAITAFGTVPRGQAILRKGAQVGDLLCVTGTIGDGALGLAALERPLFLEAHHLAALSARYYLPEPRLAAGVVLRGKARACADISDGLVADVGHICTASGVSAVIERDRIPLSAAARAAVTQDATLWGHIMGGGDDYELAFTLPAVQVDLLEDLGVAAGTPLTVIGRIVAAESGRLGEVIVVDAGGRPVNVPVSGYRHR